MVAGLEEGGGDDEERRRRPGGDGDLVGGDVAPTALGGDQLA
ncbi:MAG: hypothetical protein U0R24_10360 [Solirubrobacterales bacterium]